jgi:hypothetical protein
MFFIYYFTRLQFLIPAFKDIDSCIEYNTLNFPEAFTCWTWKGEVERRRGSLFCALEYWFRGWKLRKTDFRLNNNIAITLTDMGFLDDAEAFLKNAEESLLPTQRKKGEEFIAHERERIKKAREIIKSRIMKQEIAKRIILPK